MVFRDMTPTEMASVALYLLTILLLLHAMSRRLDVAARVAAVAALLSVTGANGFLLLSYAGETAVYERPGPIKRRGAGERGYFEFEHEGEAKSQTAHGGGNDGEGVVLATWSGPNDAKAARWLDNSFNDCRHCPPMVTVPAGYFRMGASPDDAEATIHERPTRVFGFGTPFAIGRFEVTVGEYSRFVKATGYAAPACPGHSAEDGDPELPVTCVSWHDAYAYVSWLKQSSGRPFRLPSEAEWEYAARAGATGPYGSGDRLGRGDANIERVLTVPVGHYPANGYGLHDTHGNAAEIVDGCWTASPAEVQGDGKAATPTVGCNRVLRDAHAGEAMAMTRLSARRPINPDDRLPGVGFRVARDLR